VRFKPCTTQTTATLTSTLYRWATTAIAAGKNILILSLRDAQPQWFCQIPPNHVTCLVGSRVTGPSHCDSREQYCAGFKPSCDPWQTQKLFRETEVHKWIYDVFTCSATQPLHCLIQFCKCNKMLFNSGLYLYHAWLGSLCILSFYTSVSTTVTLQ
jgi:hypothetical protein